MTSSMENSIVPRPRWAFLLVIVITVLAVDQATKTLVVRNLALFESFQPIPAVVPYFQITHSYNTGAAFGFMAGTDWAGRIFFVLALVVSGVLTWTYRNLTDAQWGARLATGMVIGGALGNAIDRVIYGHVVDFIHYQIPNVISNVSNLADHAIVFGVFLMILSTWRIEPEPEPAEAGGQPTVEPPGSPEV
jgi:signal peptidase II